MDPRLDPILRGARREALAGALIWFFAMVYTVIYCGHYGYDRPAADLHFVLGFPAWVFWGVVVPWVTCVAISFWFSFWFMDDEGLGEEPGESEDGGPLTGGGASGHA